MARQGRYRSPIASAVAFWLPPGLASAPRLGPRRPFPWQLNFAQPLRAARGIPRAPVSHSRTASRLAIWVRVRAFAPTERAATPSRSAAPESPRHIRANRESFPRAARQPQAVRQVQNLFREILRRPGFGQRVKLVRRSWMKRLSASSMARVCSRRASYSSITRKPDRCPPRCELTQNAVAEAVDRGDESALDLRRSSGRSAK